MRAEIVAVGTELLLGDVVDTNSSFIAQRLAAAGIECHFQTRVGDNSERIVEALERASARAEAVVVCGGLGPTPDDITRDALAKFLGVPLERDQAMVGRIGAIFETRSASMPANNARQGDRPRGGKFIEQRLGTAPGLICMSAQGSVIYAVPGVPAEMTEMMTRAVIPDLRRQVGPAGTTTIVSRSLLTWGLSESALAELVAERIDAQTNPTLAFLASGPRGIKLRITARAADAEEATAMIEAEEAELRTILGSLVFGIDTDSMASAVGRLVEEKGLTVGVAESLTGGLVGAALAEVPGSSAWFRGSVVAYHPTVKFNVVGVPEGPVVAAEAAEALALGAARVLGADIGLGITGAAGPEPCEDQPPGTVFMATAIDGQAISVGTHIRGDREQVRHLAVINLLNLLRLRLG